MQDQAQEQEEEVKASFEGGEEPDSAPPRSDLESADSGSHDDDVAEQSASVEVTEATLEMRQTKAISESAGQPNEESAD